VQFEVLVDDQRIHLSSTFNDKTQTGSVDVVVTDKNKLTRRVLDAGDGLCGDHADWANA
jgi:hypothetical protein